jgi:protein-S-isoprenylcysteine O-methyltransferase Ste14
MAEFIFEHMVVLWVMLAVIVFVCLFFYTAPYGRHSTKSLTLSVKGPAGWVLMEMPASLVFAACFITVSGIYTVTQIVLLIVWQIHYAHRAFIYPFTLRSSEKPLAIWILLSGFVFNLVNAYLNGCYISMNPQQYPAGWLLDPRFITGLAIFIAGFVINRQSDYILYKIRGKDKNVYEIPQGGLFKWVSCPNYLGEMLIWFGWAIAAWSPVGLAFALWTVANLAPRARSHHRWYHEKFEDYPEERRALVPGLW